MAKKRRKKKEEHENETYEIEINDWEVAYRFGLNALPKDLVRGVYWEYSKLILAGKILSPVVEKASKVRIEMTDEPQMDDHWKSKPTIISAEATGYMQIPRGDDTLTFYCSIPSRFLQNITLAVHSGKIQFVSISSTKLKSRQGTISSVTLSRAREDEEE